MNWAVLLSKHPRPILNDEHPLMLLALLESAGLMSERDLEARANQPAEAFRKDMLKLQMDQLIEFGKAHVRLSDAGKEVLGRLRLSGVVLDNLLDELNIRDEERREYRDVLDSYRKHSFRLYQNSICTVNAWRQVATDAAPAEGFTSRHVRASAKSLLMRDLRNWYFHSHVGRSAIDSTSTVLREHLLADWSSLTKRSPSDLTTTFLVVLDTEWKDLKLSGGIGKSARLLKNFHHFQCASAPDTWFDSWTFVAEQFSRSRSRRGVILDHISGSSQQSSDDGAGFTSECSAFLSEAWRPLGKLDSPPDFHISKLLRAKTIAELAAQTDISEQTLRKLLVDLDGSLTALLAPQRTQTLSQPDATHARQRTNPKPPRLS
jgi:hypothetical protein